MPVLPWEPGEREHGRPHAVDDVAGQPCQRDHDVGDDDRRGLGRAGAEHRDGAALHRGGGEVVAVDPLPHDRHEQPALDGLAVVTERLAGHRDLRVAVHLAAHDLGDLGQRHGDHASTSSSARTTSRSSKGSTTPATSWPVS